MTALAETRKYLHAHPELSCEEKNTSRFITEKLQEAGVKTIYSDISLYSLAAVFNSGVPGPAILFRCELDALPIAEVNTFAHRSTKAGTGHKCGHDGHMTIMLGLAQEFVKRPLSKGKAVLLFQSGEETGDGAKGIVDSHFLEQFNIDYAFALHNIPGYPLHEIICRPGNFTPAVESLTITLQGKTSHAGEPGKGINPAATIAEIITYFKTLHDPDRQSSNYFVSTPVQIRMGEEAFGTSAGEGLVSYTFRTWENDRLAVYKKEIEQQVAEIVKKEKGLHATLHWVQPFNANRNNEAAYALIRKAAEQNGFHFTKREEPFDWGEDFGLFTERYKGAMFGVGSGEDCPSLHNPDYDFPDALITTGINMFYSIATLIAE